MVRDLRVILVKLADRTHNMRTIEGMPAPRRRAIARETLDIYAPLAERLGLYNLKLELEDLGFRALYPQRYRVLERAMKRARGNQKEFLPKIAGQIRIGLENAGIEARVGLDYRSSQEPDPFARVLDTTPNASGCSDARCSGLAGTIPAVTLFNAGLSYTPREGHVTFFGSAWNLFGKEYLASRVDGMAVGRQRTIVGGVRVRF